MLNSVRGELSEKAPGVVRVLTGGVEWELEVSAATLSALPEVGRSVRVFSYLYHREDQMRLYGFASVDERKVFLDLLRVGGIGPKQALKILSRISLDNLVQLIDTGDADALSTVPGLGVKTAGKIILTLKGKLSLKAVSTGSAGMDDLVSGLVDMGFDRRAAAEAVRRVSSDLAEGGLEGEDLDRETLRRAIIELS